MHFLGILGFAFDINNDALVRYLVEKAPFLLGQKELEKCLIMAVYINREKYYRWFHPYVEHPENIKVTLSELRTMFPWADYQQQVFTLPELAMQRDTRALFNIMRSDPIFKINYTYV